MRPLRLIVYILAVAAVAGCTTTRQAQTLPTTPQPPAWVTNRPAGGDYYIGIGQSSVAPGIDYQAVAKKNALNDLASEIKVQVNSSSMLYTIEREYKFSEEFTETINTRTDLDLSDYEQADNWQDGTTYWVYYRLDKAEYARRRNAEKAKAGAEALALYQQALKEAGAERFQAAATAYLEGLHKLAEFRRESVPVFFNGDTVQIGSQLVLALRDLLTNTQVLSAPSAGINLNYFNGYTAEVEISCLNEKTGLPMSGVPISYSYFGKSGVISGTQYTPANGKLHLKIVDADRDNITNGLRVGLDSKELQSWAAADPFLQSFLEKIQPPPLFLPIQFQAPKVFLAGTEQNMGVSLESEPIETALKSLLLKNRIPVAAKSEESQLVLNIRATTRKGEKSDGFAIAYLTVTLTVQDQATGKAVFTKASEVKGVSVTFDKAGDKAIAKYIEDLPFDIGKPLINSILN